MGLLLAASLLSCATPPSSAPHPQGSSGAPESAAPETDQPESGVPDTRRTVPGSVPEIGPPLEPAGSRSMDAVLDTAAVEREVRAFLEASARAWNRDDLDAFVATYTDAPDLTFVGGAEVVRDREQLLENYASSWFSGASEPPDLRFSDVEVRPLSDRHALAFGRWTLYLAGFEVQTLIGTGWFTLVLERDAQGWVIVHDHSSSLDDPGSDP